MWSQNGMQQWFVQLPCVCITVVAPGAAFPARPGPVFSPVSQLPFPAGFRPRPPRPPPPTDSLRPLHGGCAATICARSLKSIHRAVEIRHAPGSPAIPISVSNLRTRTVACTPIAIGTPLLCGA